IISFMWCPEQVSPMEIDNTVNDDISVFDGFETKESFAKMDQVLGVIAVVGQASRHFDPLVTNIIELTKSTLDIYENVQFNKKICDCLIDRVESVEMAIKSLKRHKEENARYFFNQTTYNTFHQLIVVLEKMQQYITDVSQLHGLRKFTNIMDIKKQFEELTVEFDMIVSTLQLKMAFSEKEQSIRDKAAIEDDINTTTKFLSNVKSGITRDIAQDDTTPLKPPQISDIFDEIIKKKNFVTETNKTTKFKAKIIPSDKIINPDGPSKGNVHRMQYEDKFVACSNPIQRDFTKIIRAAWQDDPTLRPGLHELFIQLDKLHKDNPVELAQPMKKNHIEMESTDAQSEIIVVEENNVQDKDLELKFL
ncbi:27011_t:CDS:2, partial [Dentiscutata erythropus]